MLDAPDGWCGSIGRPRGQKHVPYVHLSSLARGLGRSYARLPVRSMLACHVVFSMLMWLCMRSEVLSSATELLHRVGGPVSDAQTMCWMVLKACVNDRMPCIGVLMPYRANKNALFDACSLLESHFFRLGTHCCLQYYLEDTQGSTRSKCIF